MIEAAHSQRRLGELSRLLRRRSGRSRKWVAEKAQTERSLVRSLERGKVVEPDVAARIMAVVEIELDERRASSVAPPLIKSGELSLGLHTQSLPEDNDPEVVLQMYLDLVCSIRGGRGRSLLTLRNSDIDELSEVLHMPQSEVAALLARLMAVSLVKDAS